MTEKRYVIEEIGNMFRVLKDNEPLTTKFENTDKQDVTNLIAELNELHEENQGLRNFKEKSDKFTKEVENFFKKHNIDTVNFDLIEEEFELYRKENKELKVNNGEMEDYLARMEEENKELKKQLEREETDKKRLMSYLMKYKGLSFDEIVEDFLDNSYYDNWWENGFYESCWDEYLKEKGFDGCDEE